MMVKSPPPDPFASAVKLPNPLRPPAAGGFNPPFRNAGYTTGHHHFNVRCTATTNG